MKHNLCIIDEWEGGPILGGQAWHNEHNDKLMHNNSTRSSTLTCLFLQQKNTGPSDGKNHDAGVYWD